MKPLVPKVG